MNRKSTLLFCSLLVVLTLWAGCAKKPNDAQITSDIQNKFGQDSGLSQKQLGVQAADGVVTLSGTVDNDAQRQAASRHAASTAGVREVVNNLQVGGPSVAAATAPTNPPTTVMPTNAVTPSRPKSAAGAVSRKAPVADSTKIDDSQSPQGADQMSAGNGPTSDPPPGPPPAPADSTPPPLPAPPAPKKFIIDQGTQFTVRLMDPIDSEKNQTGDNFHATLKAPLTSDGEEAVPAGVELTGHLVEVKSASKFAGQSEVILQLDSLSSGGQIYSVQTDQYKKTASSRSKNTAEKVGGGAVLGGIIGALAGGGKGAAIGAAAGAGVGGGVQAATKSQQIKLPSETVLSFTLQSPITVVQAPSPDASRQRLDNSQ